MRKHRSAVAATALEASGQIQSRYIHLSSVEASESWAGQQDRPIRREPGLVPDDQYLDGLANARKRGDRIGAAKPVATREDLQAAESCRLPTRNQL